MQNLKMHTLSDNLKSVCDKAIKDGVPEYAVLLILEKTINDYIQPLVQAKMKEEIENYKEGIKKAKPKGGPVTEDLPKKEVE